MVRPQLEARLKHGKKKTGDRCPECGKDIHDPDCAYNPSKAR